MEHDKKGRCLGGGEEEEAEQYDGWGVAARQSGRLQPPLRRTPFPSSCKAPISSQPLQLLLHPDFHLAWLRSSIRVWSSGTPLVISPRFRVYSYSTRRRVRLSSLTGLTRAMVMREGSRVAPTTWSCVRWLKATIPMVVPFLIKF